MKDKIHIAIVGAGLVGSLVALYLRKRGYRITVFERRPDLRKERIDGGRSINLALSARGLKALDEHGLADTIRQIAIPMHGRMMHDVAGALTFQRYGKEGEFINSVSRSDLNIVLINEAEKVGAEFCFGRRCVNVDLNKTELTVTEGPTQNGTTNHFDVIIGADGAFSAVRSAMQITDRFNYSQHYIEHGYKELHIPASASGEFQLGKNALHIWPRESFMMIALPNPDKTFTCTLFLPFNGGNSFAELQTEAKISQFFETFFPDATRLMPTLLEDFRRNATSSLVTIKCHPWVINRTLLIGDAAHAIVPFYGQGMNAGFEDCSILNKMLDDANDDWGNVLGKFPQQRKQNADAIAQLALENFIEMRDHVADEKFLLQKKIEAKIHELHPGRWIPQYSMVTFRPDIPYANAMAIGRRQTEIMNKIMAQPDIERSWENLDFGAIAAQLDDKATS